MLAVQRNKDEGDLKDAYTRLIRMYEEFLRFDGSRRQVRRRRAILEASSDQFVRFGYRKTTIDDILNSAGISRGTLYAYYESKAEILLHAIAYQKMVYLENHVSEFDHLIADRELLHLLIVHHIEMTYTIPVINSFLDADTADVQQFISEIDPASYSILLDDRRQFWAAFIQSASTRKLKPKELGERSESLHLVLNSALAGRKLIPDREPVRPHAERVANILVSGVLE